MARGDRLAVRRRVGGSGAAYTHFGIDLGDGAVAHAQPHDPGRPFDGGSVVRTTLDTFAGGASVRRVVDPPAMFCPAEVAARAEAAVGRAGYCPLGDNCEHFATWCATGRRESAQSAILVGRTGAVAARMAAAIAARLAAGPARRLAVRTALGTTARVSLRTLVPAAIAAEGAAFVAEWTAHQRGATAGECRRAGESAGLATSAGACALAAAAGGPAAIVSGALAGAALWAGGAAALAAFDRLCRRESDHPADSGDPPRRQ